MHSLHYQLPSLPFLLEDFATIRGLANIINLLYNSTMDEILLSYLEKIEKSLDNYLPKVANNKWKKLSFGDTADCLKNEHFENLSMPCLSLIKQGGKRWRPLLMVMIFQLAKECKNKPLISNDDFFLLSPLIEYVHTASLIHDDIEDSSDTRRENPATHIQYGTDVALNAASWLYFEASTCIDSLDIDEYVKNKLYSIYLTEVRRLHLGQALDIYWHKNASIFPSLEEYEEMVKCKTGTLAKMAVKIGALLGGGTNEEIENAGKIALNIGMAFQILDDVQNLTTGNPGKKRGDDIVEGKKSFPILLHLNEKPADKAKIENYFAIAKIEGIESTAIENCIELLTESNAIKIAEEKGKKYMAENIEKLIKIFGNNTKHGELIRKMFKGKLI